MKLRGQLSRAVAGIVPPKEIEDIVQETYVRACHTGRSDAIRQPKAYLFKVARNLALDHVNRADHRRAISENDIDDERLAEVLDVGDLTLDRVAVGNQFSDFCDAVRRLPVQQRRAFVLKKVYGYTQREIGELMQISEKTVERHISLAMERCMDYLHKHDDLLGRRKTDSPRRGDLR